MTSQNTIKRAWLMDDIAALRRWVAAGMTDAQIGAAMHRTAMAVTSKRRELRIFVSVDEALARSAAVVARRREELAARAVPLFAAGLSVAQIARDLGYASETVTDALRHAGCDTSRGTKRGTWLREQNKRAANAEYRGCVEACAVKPAPGDLSAIYRGRRYDADDMRFRPSGMTLRPAPPATHVPTQSTLA